MEDAHVLALISLATCVGIASIILLRRGYAWLGLLAAVIVVAALAALATLQAQSEAKASSNAAPPDNSAGLRIELDRLLRQAGEDARAAGELLSRARVLAHKLGDTKRPANDPAAEGIRGVLAAIGDELTDVEKSIPLLLSQRASLARLVNAQLSTPFFEIEPLPDNEMVVGLVGRYYRVYLRDGGGRYLQFQDRRYVFDEKEAQFNEAFANFVTTAFNGLPAPRIFLQGTADPRSFDEGPLDPVHRFDKLRFLPSDGRGKYLMDEKEEPAPSKVHNAVLPDLRSTYVRTLISRAHKGLAVQILKGQIKQGKPERAKTVDIVIYLKP
jgi:hypothetical protein